MPTAEQQSRLERIESGAEARAHQSVIIVRPGDDVAALIAAAACARGYGHLVLPDDVDEATWEARARDYFARQPKP